MKKILLILILLIQYLASQATTYYISATGSDSNSGLTTSLPKQTLTAVNALGVPGDSILFKRGDGWYGTLIASVDSVVYGVYGTGATPTITGFTTVTAWTNLGSNIWESTSAVSTLTDCNIVSINGVNTPMGRTPNIGTLYTVTSHSSNASITCSALTGTPDWTGAEVVIRKARWIWQRANVTSQTTSTVSYTDIQSGSFSPQDGWGFFFQDDVRTLDTQNEWYYNPTTKKIRIYSTSQPANVKVASSEYLVTSSGDSYITIENINFTGANTYAISLATGTNIRVLNCDITFSGETGVSLNNIDSSVLSGCTISDSNNSALLSTSTCDSDTIIGNIIQRSGMFAGMTLLYTSGVQIYGTNSLFINNIIDYSGYDGIFVGASSLTIKNNFIDHSCQTFADGAGIYTAGAKTKVFIDGNVVLNTLGNIDGVGTGSTLANGIYLDMPSVNVTVKNNTTAYNTDDGIFLNYSSYDDSIINNTSYGNGEAGFYSANYTGDDTKNIYNIVITGNVFVAKAATDFAFELRSALNDIDTWGIVSDNNIFARPIDDTGTLFIGQPNTYTGGLQYKTLAQWQVFSGKDVNSTKSPFAVSLESDLRFEYNETSTPKTVILDQNYRDIDNNADHTSYTVPTWDSVVLIKHAAYGSTAGRKTGRYRGTTGMYRGNVGRVD